MSKNNKLEKFLSLFPDDIIKKRKSSVEIDNNGSINTLSKASGNQFEMFNKIHITKETNNFDNKVLLDKQLFKTTVFKDDWNKAQWKMPNNQNSKLLIKQSSPKRTKYIQESELSDKLTFPTLFSSPERKPSKIIIDNNNSQKQSGPTILSYFKERKKTVKSENQCSPRKNGSK